MATKLLVTGLLLVLGGLLVGAGLYLHRSGAEANRQTAALVVIVTLFLAALLMLFD